MGKFSEITGDRCFEVLGETIEPIMNIAADEDASELFGRKMLPEGMTPWEYAMQRLRKATPALMKNHKDDLIAISASLNGVKVKDYAKNLNMKSMMEDLVDLMSDPTFNAFFTSAQSQTTDT